MNTFQIVILVALLGNTLVGLFVLLSNPKRILNIGFSILSIQIIIWLGSMFLCSLQHSEVIRLFWVRQTSAAGGALSLGFFFIYTIVSNPGITIRQSIYKLRYWILACIAVFVLCHSSVFAISAKPVSEIELVPPTEYGWGFWLFIAFFFAVIVAMAVGFLKERKRAVGVQKEELLFLQLGGCASLIFGVSILVAAEILNEQGISGFMPLSVLMLDGFIAYGIATRRILAASVVIQRVVSYALMACYLILLYVLIEWIAARLFILLIDDTVYISHLLAALIVAFSVAPAHGWMQAVSHRLFASANLLNVNVVLEQAAQMFQEVSTEASLMEKFSELIQSAFGTTGVVLLRPLSGGAYQQSYPAPTGSPVLLQPGSCLVQLLNQEHEAFTVDTLHRMRPVPAVTGALDEMEQAGAALVIGSFMRKEMKAVLLLAQKKSGRIYDLRDQRALQLLCDQLAVALENANLYTAIQNGKIYNEILLDSLTSGIIAVNSDRVVTVFNQRAQTLTGLEESAVVNRPMTVLPASLADSLQVILNTQAGFRDKDMSVLLGGEEIPVRVSGSIFRSHTGSPLGGLLVFNDMTVLKKMEEQIRRTDRLSSIGTLSAGMAHEIKNPLVTIKTFTQLLPQNYSDTDFRRTFFDLVGQEVKRIDAIVNRLLNFARPAKACLKPVSLHEIVENSLRLAEQQLVQHEIVLNRHFDAKRHVIEADAEQLNQTFINFFLNAIHAMGKGGTLTVVSSVIRSSPDIPLSNGDRLVDRIQIDIQDTGCGIAPDQLSRIFDPFFTTKEDGVGLGLSVSHGIIQEHNGTIDVESEQGKGTVFHVQFPLLQPQETKNE